MVDRLVGTAELLELLHKLLEVGGGRVRQAQGHLRRVRHLVRHEARRVEQRVRAVVRVALVVLQLHAHLQHARRDERRASEMHKPRAPPVAPLQVVDVTSPIGRENHLLLDAREHPLPVRLPAPQPIKLGRQGGELALLLLLIRRVGGRHRRRIARHLHQRRVHTS